MTRALITALTLAVSSGALGAVPSPPAVDTRGAPNEQVSQVLERFPARDAATRDGLCAEILGLGPEALGDVCARVLPPGEGDDSRARYAVNALAVCVARPGAEAERARFARVLLDALEETRDETVAAFFLSQVQLVGKRESIRPLERYLVDEKLAGPAAAALLSIGGPDAATALLGALDEAPPEARLVLIQSLGEARSREAVPKILPFADSGDEGIRQAALYALANIGDPAAGPVLSRSRVASPLRQRRQTPSLYLLYARRLIESGQTAGGLEAARAVLDNYSHPAESQHASEALALVVSTLGGRALPDLLAAADSPDRSFRGSALTLAASIPGKDATGAWVDKARSSPSDVRADLLGMLGERGDAAALPFVRESLGSGDQSVRLAAIPAAARLGGEAVLPDLLPLLGSAGAEESAVLKTALLGYRGAVVVPEALRLLDSTPLPARTVLIDVLGEKGASDQIERLFGLCEDPEPAIRAASIAALSRLAGDADVPRLVAMAEAAGKGRERARLQETIAAVVGRTPEPDRRADDLLDLLRDSTPGGKITILEVLPRIGWEEPLGAVVEEAGSPDPAVQSAAVEALTRWPEEAAADELGRLAATTRNPEHFRAAVEGYVRLLRRSRRPTAEKLAVLQGLLDRPVEEADRGVVLAGIAGVREPESLRLLAGYLNDPALGDAASASLLDLASRQSPREPWLSGHEAYSVLRRVEASLTEASARERAGKIIVERLRQGGFVPLFDGRSLDGWKGLVADPPTRARMTAEERARAQVEADEKMRAHWSVVDGVLVFDGDGASLCTSADYADFELLVDWKIEEGADSGIYLRGSPQVQIWDGEANPVGSGGLFNNEKGPNEPGKNADRPVGEWNTFRIVMMGERVTVYLNDTRVVNHAVLENYWERDKPIYPTGQIELQAHGNPLQFRNLFIREIPADSAVTGMSAAEAGEGFRPLFNGRDLEGWTGNLDGYPAEDGKIVVRPQRGGGNLYTEKEYTDFVLRFEFKLTPAANNGLGIRAPLEGDAAYLGMELQILEDGSPVYWGLQPYQHHGSVYGVVPARRGILRPVGEWNTEEVTVVGRHVTVVVNRTTVVDADLDAASAEGTMDQREHPGLKRPRGHIGFLGHGSIVEFRNIRIKELP